MPSSPPISRVDCCRVVLVEDDSKDAARFRTMLEEGSGRPGTQTFELLEWVTGLDAALEVIASREVDLVLLNLSLPGCGGVEAVAKIVATAPQVPVIGLGDVEDEALALRVMQEGAQDYFTKGEVSARLLQRAMRYAVEREKVRRELARKREFLAVVLESTTDHIYFKDTASRFIRVNRSLATFFGLANPKDAVGKSDFDFFPAAEAELRFLDERRILETGEPVIDKVECEEMAGGAKSWVLTTKMPLRDVEGRIIGTFGVSRNITRLKEMEEALSRERNLLRSVIDNVPDFINARDKEGRYLLNNLAHVRLLKAESPQAILGKSVFDFFPEELARQYVADDEKILASGLPLVEKVEPTLALDGSERWISTTKVPLKESSGEISGLVLIARDITQQKHAKEALEQANIDLSRSQEKLVSAMEELRSVQLQLIEAEKMKLVGRLAAGVAHEVKNPLAVITMGMEYMSQQQFEDPNIAVIIHEITEAVGRADSVVRGLVDFSAPKRLHLEIADMNAVIRQSLVLIRGEMKGNQFTIIEDLDPDLPKVRMDVMKMGQVFVNILTNAIHAMPGGGELILRTRTRQITGVGENISNTGSFQLGDRLLVAEVLDTGHGLSESHEGKFFEPFFTTKPTGKGTGLGLTVTKTIIDLHSGTISIRNRPEKGACVTIELRAEDPL